MGMKSLKWEGIGTKNLFPHTSTPDLAEQDAVSVIMQSVVGYTGIRLTCTRPTPHRVRNDI